MSDVLESAAIGLAGAIIAACLQGIFKLSDKQKMMLGVLCSMTLWVTVNLLK